MTEKVLILYISKFSGHYHAACALEKGLIEAKKGLDVEKIDMLNYTNPILEKIVNKAYLEVIKKRPEFWGNIYDNPKYAKKTKKAREALHKFNMSKVKRLIERHSPDVIFCTQALPCGMIADYKRSCGKPVPLIGVLTDYAPHAYWLFEEVNYYVVPSEETGKVLQKRGIPAEKIKAHGIPVDPKFRGKHNVERLRKRLGFLARDPVILIMGGSQGLGAMEEIAKSLLKDRDHNYQILIVAGSNKKLFKRMNKLTKRKIGENIRVLSFVENIDELMEMSDIIVSKAGGMTTAEALVKGLPMIIVNPIPGQEKMNTDYLVGNGAAVEVKDLGQVHQKINEIFDSRSVLDRMKRNVEKLSKPDSALNIASLAFEG